MAELVLGLFSGVGLLDRAFAAAGFVVVQAADKITGGDIRDFRGILGRFNGIIAGPPCQGFSVANTRKKYSKPPKSVAMSRKMLQETCRIITECDPEWFLIENVPCVPDVRIEGYSVQRIPITHQQCGGVQLRSRHFQFGSKLGHIIRPQRVRQCDQIKNTVPAVTTKTSADITYPELCRRQDLETPIHLPGFCKTKKAELIGQGVPLRMGKILAEAVVCRAPRIPEADCQCDCGRSVSARALTATPSCRKRKQLASDPTPWVDIEGYHE